VVDGEALTFGLRRGPVLCIAGGGYRAALFHLGALTRLNELGLLAGTETICAVSGGSILAALLATQVPWPLYGAFREWPEQVAEPLHEICGRRPRRHRRLVADGGGAAQAERFARKLAGWDEGELPELPRVVFGAAGLELGQMAVRGEGEGEPGLRWELRRPRGSAAKGDPIAVAAAEMSANLVPLAEGERAVLANHGYGLADAALRGGELPVASLEPLPPLPPHPEWDHLRPMRRPLPWRRSRQPWRLKRTRRVRSAGEATELLRRHRPFVQHDSLESYRPAPVATIAELVVGSRCNTLHRGNGELLASVLPLAGAARLDLDYLGAPTYADGRVARADDYLDEAGGSHAGDALAAHGGRKDEVVYGRAIRSGGRLWLQYWLFYYYDDKGFLEICRHEGDWELVQVRIGKDDLPDAIACRHYARGERAGWHEIERVRGGDGEAPVVYPARGSHAPLLQPGTRPAPSVPDHNDGLGPRSRPRLIEVGESPLGWVRWPGRWGSTRRREAFEGDSPRGPAQQIAWRDPAGFHAEAGAAAQSPRWRQPPPVTPRFEARREGNHAILTYSFAAAAAGQSPPARIVASVLGEEDEAGIVHSFRVDGPVGACALPLPTGAPRLAIRACVASELGGPGATLTVPIGD